MLCAFIESARHRKLFAKPKPLKCVTTWGETLNTLRTLWSAGGLGYGKPVLFFIKTVPNTFHIMIKNFKYGEKDEVLACCFQWKTALLPWLETFPFLTSDYAWPTYSPVLVAFCILNNSFSLCVFTESKSLVGRCCLKPACGFWFLERQVHHSPNFFSCPLP